MPPQKVSVSLPQLAKMIDHSLLHPTMTDAEIQAGLEISRDHKVAAACIKPYSIQHAQRALGDSDVKICAVIGFPQGSSATTIKVMEAAMAMKEGAHEIDMVVNIGKVLGGAWQYVRDEIMKVNAAVIKEGGILKVIFENDFLGDKEIVELCKICTSLQVAFVKTSTGYGFVKHSNGMYSYKGATIQQLTLMRESCGDSIQIKAAGGVRTLDDLLRVKAAGVTRVGATATVAILDEARKRGVGEQQVEIEVQEAG